MIFLMTCKNFKSLVLIKYNFMVKLNSQFYKCQKFVIKIDEHEIIGAPLHIEKVLLETNIHII